MKEHSFSASHIFLYALMLSVPLTVCFAARGRGTAVKIVQLPSPKTSGSMTLEEAIGKRRSVREFDGKPLDFAQIGQLAWAGQGITEPAKGLRTAPSAGALYPIELYVVASQGTYVYQPKDHTLLQILPDDVRRQLAAAAMGQQWVGGAACNIVIAGSLRKVAPKYGNKARQFMLLEAGHVAQNILLQATAMGLAAVPVGAFENKDAAKALELPAELEPLLIICIGYSAGTTQSGADQAQRPRRAVLIVPPENFNDAELFDTQQVLTSAGVQTVVASTKIGPLTGTLGGLAASEIAITDLKAADFDAVIFVGGPGAAVLFENPAAQNIARDAAARQKVVAAISLAPSILANAGVLKGVKATAFLTERKRLEAAGAKYTGNPVERDGRIVTASGPLTAATFAQAILAVFYEDARVRE